MRKLEGTVVSKIKFNEKLIFDFIKQQYRPYDTHDEFGRGLLGLPGWQLPQPARRRQRLCSAWDLGAEAAMRYQRVIAG